MKNIVYQDGNGSNSAAVWVDDGGFLVYNNEENHRDDFDIEECDYRNVGDKLSFATVWESGGEAIIREYFRDVSIDKIINIDGDDYIVDGSHKAKINKEQQITDWEKFEGN